MVSDPSYAQSRPENGVDHGIRFARHHPANEDKPRAIVLERSAKRHGGSTRQLWQQQSMWLQHTPIQAEWCWRPLARPVVEAVKKGGMDLPSERILPGREAGNRLHLRSIQTRHRRKVTPIEWP